MGEVLNLESCAFVLREAHLRFPLSIRHFKMFFSSSPDTVERDCSFGNLTLELKGSGPSSAVLLRTTDHTSYSLSGHCRIEVRAPQRIVVAVREIGFRKHYDGTCQDYIQVNSVLVRVPLSVRE